MGKTIIGNLTNPAWMISVIIAALIAVAILYRVKQLQRPVTGKAAL